MNMMQVGLIGVAGALLAIQIKQEKAGIAIIVCLAVSTLIFISILDNLETLVETVKEIGNYIHIEGTYIETLIKMLGITYLAEFSSGICKDAGYQTVATQIEIFGKVTILVLSMPLFLALLRTIQEFLA